MGLRSFAVSELPIDETAGVACAGWQSQQKTAWGAERITIPSECCLVAVFAQLVVLREYFTILLEDPDRILVRVSFFCEWPQAIDCVFQHHKLWESV